jgi:hypothetical protein
MKYMFLILVILFSGCGSMLTHGGYYQMNYTSVSTPSVDSSIFRVSDGIIDLREDLPSPEAISNSEYVCLGYSDFIGFWVDNPYIKYGTTMQNLKFLADSVGSALTIIASPTVYTVEDQLLDNARDKKLKLIGLCNSKKGKKFHGIYPDLTYIPDGELPRAEGSVLYRFRVVFLGFSTSKIEMRRASCNLK